MADQNVAKRGRPLTTKSYIKRTVAYGIRNDCGTHMPQYLKKRGCGISNNKADLLKNRRSCSKYVKHLYLTNAFMNRFYDYHRK